MSLLHAVCVDIFLENGDEYLRELKLVILDQDL